MVERCLYKSYQQPMAIAERIKVFLGFSRQPLEVFLKGACGCSGQLNKSIRVLGRECTSWNRNVGVGMHSARSRNSVVFISHFCIVVL